MLLTNKFHNGFNRSSRLTTKIVRYGLFISLFYAALQQNIWQFFLISLLLVIDFHLGKYSKMPKVISKVFGFVKLLFIPVVFTVSIVSTLAVLQPAHALFFATAETFFTTKFGAIPGFATTLGLVINILRGLFVIYIIWAFVKIVEAKNSGQDASQLFQTLIITVLAGFFGDEVLKLFI
jgi:hypothetical protein